MEFLIVIFVIWLVVTLIGHASWVVLERFFGLFTEKRKPSERPFVGPRADNQACDRVLNRLVSEGMIEPSLALELRRQLQELETRQQARAADLLFPTATTQQIKPAESDQSLPSSLVAEPATADDEPVILATLVDEPPTSPATTPPATTPASLTPQSHPLVPPASPPAGPVGPALSKSEIIHSFLAAHNIRWGELVAGLLIVVCSIGLVISLWHTLVDTHRVIPSLIFLTANASIFGGGLYTLNRWRVRHTSRAVLYIATLLVPLSVLTGLVTGGTSVEAIELSDPITLVAIFISAVVYSLLLWLGGRALVGRPYAPALVLAVVGPSAVLPLMPAGVRALTDQAGWLVGIGAIAILAALVWMVPARRRSHATAGPAGARNRLLMMSVSAFTLAVSIAYAGFAVYSYGLDAMIPIAIASLPALVGIAGAGRWVMLSARNATQSMIGATACVIAIGLTWAALPASMSESYWVWSWGAVLSISSLAVGWLLKQSRWLAAATIPVGLAATLSSPVWLSDQVWQSIPLWRRFVGGEPMIAAAIVAVAVALFSRLLQDRESRRWVSISAACWAGFSLLGAAILALGPTSWFGIAPSWSPTLVLVAGVAASIAALTQRSVRPHAIHVAFVTIGLIVLAWMSFYRPLVLSLPALWSTPSTWMITAMSVAASLLLLAEVVPRLRRFDRRATCDTSEQWVNASVAAAVLAAVIACLTVRHDDWVESAIYLALATGLILWSSTRSRSIVLARIAQLVSICLAIVIGYSQFRGELFASEAWIAARAPWGWSVLAATVTAAWFTIRELTKLDSPLARRRLGFLRSNAAGLSEMIDGPTLAAAAAMITVGSTWAFAALLSSAAEGDWIVNQAGVALPLVAIASASGLIAWMRRHWIQPNRQWTVALTATVAVSAVVWAPAQFATWLPISATQQLILATSLLALGCIAVERYLMPIIKLQQPSSDRFALRAASIPVALASAVLLGCGWFEPIIDGRYAQWQPTFAVATWGLIGSLLLLVEAKQQRTQSLAVLSCLLAPAAIAIIVPVYSTAHPLVWIQVAAIASLAWVGAGRWFLQGNETVEPAARGSLWFVAIVGFSSAILATTSILLNVTALHVIFGPAGALVSLFAVLLACSGSLPSMPENLTRIPWPIGLSLLAGQAAWLSLEFGSATGSQLVDVIAMIGCVAAFASLLRYASISNRLDLVHAALVSVGVCIITIAAGASASTVLITAGLSSCVIGGLLVEAVGKDSSAGHPQIAAARMLGWFIVIAGGYLLSKHVVAAYDENVFWMALVVWLATWVVIWRAVCPDRDRKVCWRALADTEFAVLTLLAAVGETAVMINSGSTIDLPSTWIDGCLWIRVIAYIAVAVSTSARGNRQVVWPAAIGLVMAAVSLVGVRFAIDSDATWYGRLTVAMTSAGVALALITYLLQPISQFSSRLCAALGGLSPTKIGGLVRDTFFVSLGFAAIAILVSIAMIADQAPRELTPLVIGAVALAALAIVELAELSRMPRIRQAAMTLILVSIGLWASISGDDEIYRWLHMSMRWLVASVFTIPMTLLVMPKVLGDAIAERWRPAFRQAAVVATTTAGLSLATMLAIEAVVRHSDGIAGVSRPLVIGVAVTMGILSALAALIAVLSGPGSAWRTRLNLNDRQRQILIVAAQLIGAVTWLHVFLCKTQWAFIGLRGYWPYIVMGLAFVTVGVTEWAKRRGDRLLSDTLSQTALYLPLVPVIGFWLSVSPDDWTWTFARGKVPYALLLTIGAAYYVGLSAMWRGVIPKAAAMLLGNGAIWVVLVQTPGWGFLSHPQAWLIPPAVCVLVVAHLYRDRLEPAVASGIRYASMLVIYVSSTADILLQQIGTNIAGPIVLILLALAGMAAGVVLRVRPFLYLGATFVFVGVTSMVWHATESIDENWPWWVFGITTGVCLLAGLMAIEKNKPKLRHFAESLASWEA